MIRSSALSILLVASLLGCGSSKEGGDAAKKETPADMCKWLEAQGVKSDEGWKENTPGQWYCLGDKVTGDGSGVNATSLKIHVQGSKDAARSYQVGLKSFGPTAGPSTTANKPALVAAVEEVAKKATGKPMPAAVKGAIEGEAPLEDTKDGAYTWSVRIDKNQDTTGTNPSATRSVIEVILTFPETAAPAGSAK